MKFTTVFAVLATLATAVSATLLDTSLNTNAKRFAAGLGPLTPVRRDGKKGTPTHSGHKGKPSGISGSCNSGPVQCCNSVTNANPATKSFIEGIVGMIVAPDVAVGLTCSPIGTLLGKTSCTAQTVCCDNNNFKGVVAIGCSPININLV